MRNTFLMSAAAMLLAAAPAAAQDMAAPPPAPQDAPAPAPAYASATGPTTGVSPNGTSLRGIRIEGNFGWDDFRSQGTSRSKFGYGATLGFDGQIGDRFVIGPEASYWRANNYSEICTANNGGQLCTKSFDEYSVGARAGILVAPQLLVFGKGGYVNNEQRKRFTAPAGRTGFYDHYSSDGYQWGGGAELSMANRFRGPLSGVYLSAQYIRDQYSDHTSRQRVMGGVGIRFR
jgi:outer membrane immunogenic protein